MDRQTKLDVLQKELSRKDLTFGCVVFNNNMEGKGIILEKTSTKEDLYVRVVFSGLLGHTQDRIIVVDLSKYEIIGHPVILSDVLVLCKEKGCYFKIDQNGMGYIDYKNNVYDIDRDLTKPYLSEQDDTVVDGLYEVFLLTKKD